MSQQEEAQWMSLKQNKMLICPKSQADRGNCDSCSFALADIIDLSQQEFILRVEILVLILILVHRWKKEGNTDSVLRLCNFSNRKIIVT